MPPKRELSIRLRAELREALDQAAAEQGQTITAIVEAALGAHLGIDKPEQGQTLADRVRDLEQRVRSLEGTAMHRTAPPRKTPPPPSSAVAPATGQASTRGRESYSTAEALIQMQAPITEAQARGTNANAVLRRATGQSVAEWLGARGWVKDGKRWQRVG